MSIRSKVLGLVDIILRVPPLFIIDELFRINLGLFKSDETDSTDMDYGSVEDFKLLNNQSLTAELLYYYVFGSKYMYISVVKVITSVLGCIAASCVFMLWTKQLVVVYMYMISVGIVFVSYWANVSTVKTVVSSTQGCILDDILSLNKEALTDTTFLTLFQNYFVQIMLAYAFSYIHLGPRYSILNKLLPLSFLAPSILALLPFPSSFLSHAPVFSALLPLAMVKFVLWCSAYSIFHTIYGGYQHTRNFICNFGLSALLETEWSRLNVPCVLRTFWLLRVAEHASAMMYSGWRLADTPWMLLLDTAKSLLISGCETLTAVLGMTSVISYLCHYIGCFFQWVLLTEDDDDGSIGTVSAILFYILALQTGLTGLEPEKRFVRLCRNFCLLFTALLHFIHNIVNPLLMSLSASHNPCVYRHLRALLVCMFLILYPVSLLVYLWSHHALSTWLLAVSAFSVEVIVKVIVSLLIYSLFLLDAYRSTFWEKLDDYVYYIKAFGNTVEFCFGIFLFFNGAWILVFESGGAIRAGMMCIHAYFNIWSEARAGWSVFMKRRTAVNKIESLPEASVTQLDRLDDVCAICYQEMKTAKITRCNHFFHGVCLRKWLYVQDRCPLCHDILYKVEGETNNKDDVAGTDGRLLIPPLPVDDNPR